MFKIVLKEQQEKVRKIECIPCSKKFWVKEDDIEINKGIICPFCGKKELLGCIRTKIIEI